MCDHFYNLFLLFLYCSWSPSARLDELLYIIGNLRIENRNRQMGENKGRHVWRAHPCPRDRKQENTISHVEPKREVNSCSGQCHSKRLKENRNSLRISQVQSLLETRKKSAPVNPQVQPDCNEHHITADPVNPVNDERRIDIQRQLVRNQWRRDHDREKRTYKHDINQKSEPPVPIPAPARKRLVPLPVQIIMENDDDKENHPEDFMMRTPDLAVIQNCEEKEKHHCVYNHTKLHNKPPMNLFSSL